MITRRDITNHNNCCSIDAIGAAVLRVTEDFITLAEGDVNEGGNYVRLIYPL